MIVKVNGTDFECEKALRGPDYIHLLDVNNTILAAFDGVVDFSVFTISGGDWTTPSEEDECYLAMVRDDGVVCKSGLKCGEIQNEINNKAPAYTYGTDDLTAGESPLETGKLYFVYE